MIYSVEDLIKKENKIREIEILGNAPSVFISKSGWAVTYVTSRPHKSLLRITNLIGKNHKFHFFGNLWGVNFVLIILFFCVKGGLNLFNII